MTRDKITVVTAANTAYLPHVGAMLHSLFTNTPDQSFDIHFLHRSTLDKRGLTKLEFLCANFKASLHTHAIPSERLSQFPLSDLYPEEAWYRLILPEILCKKKRVLWLDADVLVLKPITQLWKTDLLGLSIAAVPNVLPFVAWNLPNKLGIPDRKQYFNTGVLILNLEQMREECVISKFNHIAEKFRAVIQHADQDVMNVYYQNKWKKIPLRWNVIATTYYLRPECKRLHGYKEYKLALNDPNIVHFTGGKRLKPWSYSSPHPYREEYLLHRKYAGWPPPDYSDRRLKDEITRRVTIRFLILISRIVRLQWRDLIATI